MNRYIKRFTVLLLIVSAVFVSACSEEDIIDYGDWTDQLQINPNYVPIDWTSTHLLSSNDSTGAYQIQFDGDVPDIHPGSIISIDRDTMVYHRFVTNVNVSGHTVNISSVEAYLTDIFANTDFTLLTSPASKPSIKGGRAFYPVKAWQKDESGMFQPLPLKSKDNESTHFTYGLWDFEIADYNIALPSWETFKASMEEVRFGLDVDLEMYMNFGGESKIEFIGNGIKRYLSEALQVNAYIDGTISTKQVANIKITGKIKNKTYEDRLLDLSKYFNPIYVTFMVGPVPITIEITCDIYFSATAKSTTTLSLTAGITDEVHGRLGFEWSQTNGMTPVQILENNFDYTTPKLQGQVDAEATVNLFPRIKALVYGFIGPSFDIKPFLTTSVSGGYGTSLPSLKSHYYAWDFDIKGGLGLCCGLSLEIFGKDTTWSTKPWNFWTGKIYHSPHRITHASGRPGVNHSAQVNFYVFDKDYIRNLDVLTCLPQLVEFEANGQLSEAYAAVQDGLVSVYWTPCDSADVLYARLYNLKGQIIAWDTVHPIIPPPTSDWVDLGLPSGLLWATHNVGATNPEDFGDYFAWGETQPKSEYSKYTYQYTGVWSIYKLTKYCDENYGDHGYSDNLTILQPSDDAATANWGNGARTPTKEEWAELLAYTTHQFTTTGLLFVGSNGNSIFLPKAGCIYNGNQILDNTIFYWSSSLYTDNQWKAWCYHSTHLKDWDRVDGMPVRPVRSPSKK